MVDEELLRPSRELLARLGADIKKAVPSVLPLIGDPSFVKDVRECLRKDVRTAGQELRPACAGVNLGSAIVLRKAAQNRLCRTSEALRPSTSTMR